MALPTAPLGQLPNMNMPYSIPTYEKGPSIWEKALASFLVNAAGGVAQQGVENVMSRDYATDFGEEKAGGLSKLLSGPRVGKEDARLRKQQAFAADEAEATRMFQGGEADAAAMNAMSRLDKQLAADKESQDFRSMLQLGQSDAEALNARARQDRDIESRTALARLEEQLRNERPDVQSQAARDNAAASEAQARAEFQRSIMSQLQTSKPTAATQSAPTPSSPVDQVASAITQQQAVTPEQRQLLAFLSSPEGRAKYPTGQDIMGPTTISDILRLLPVPEAY